MGLWQYIFSNKLMPFILSPLEKTTDVNWLCLNQWSMFDIHKNLWRIQRYWLTADRKMSILAFVNMTFIDKLGHAPPGHEIRIPVLSDDQYGCIQGIVSVHNIADDFIVLVAECQQKPFGFLNPNMGPFGSLACVKYFPVRMQLVILLKISTMEMCYKPVLLVRPLPYPNPIVQCNIINGKLDITVTWPSQVIDSKMIAADQVSIIKEPRPKTLSLVCRHVQPYGLICKDILVEH